MFLNAVDIRGCHWPPLIHRRTDSGLRAGRVSNVGSGANPDNCVDTVNPAAREVLCLLELAPRLDGYHCPGSYIAFLASNESKLVGSLY